MAKITYVEKLFEDLKKLDGDKWYRCPPEPDYTKFVKAIKSFIGMGEPYEFSDDFSKVKRISEFCDRRYHHMKVLPEGFTIEKIESGHRESINFKGREVILEHEKTSYRIFNGNRLIAIESLK